MLIFDTKSYCIYPSWVQLWFRWKDIKTIFDDPIGSGFMSSSDFSEPFNILAQRDYELINGPEGGGIIVLPHISDEYGKTMIKWKEAVDIIYKETEIATDTDRIFGICPSANIAVLVPRQVPLLVRLGIEKKQKIYRCSGTFEHVDFVGENIYVAIITNTGLKNKLADQLRFYFISLAQHFDISLKYMESTPESIALNRPHWFRFEKKQFHWFFLNTTCKEVQRIFAMLYYCALCMKKKIGNNMDSILLYFTRRVSSLF
jgi:hypothetical protein